MMTMKKLAVLERRACTRYAPVCAALREAWSVLDDLISLAEAAMLEANRDGAEYDIRGEVEDVRAALPPDWKENADGK